MKIHEWMTSDVESCSPATDLAAVAMIMWRNDCGIVPVVDEDGVALGVITDRDICMAAATRHRRPADIAASEAMSAKLFTVKEDDDVKLALERMTHERVRRLPVTDHLGHLKGLISINDIVLQTRPAGVRVPSEPSVNDLLAALKVICGHPLPAILERPAAELETVLT
jgi:CBS domain-containing protein